MTREEAIDFLAEDVVDGMDLKDMICYISEELKDYYKAAENEELAQIWHDRFEGMEQEKENPFK